MAQTGTVRDIVNVQLSKTEAHYLFELLGQTPGNLKVGVTDLEEGLARIFTRDAA